MYISIDMYHDRKENKNVGTFGFVQLYIISQHCLRFFKSHDFCSIQQNTQSACTTREKERDRERKRQIRVWGPRRESNPYYICQFQILSTIIHRLSVLSTCLFDKPMLLSSWWICQDPYQQSIADSSNELIVDNVVLINKEP
jgi:hypothetical protein